MDEQNNLDWKIYESLTKYIYETLRKEYNIHIEGYGPNCKVTGSSGVSHQIDVLTSESDGNHTYKTAIECKYWKKKVTKDTVMKLLPILNDTDIERGIIVSKNGFTRDAQKFADHHNIKIVQLRESAKQDNIEDEIEFAIFDLFFKININRPEITKIVVKTTEETEIILDENEQYQIFIKSAEGNKIRLFDSIMVFKDFLHAQKPFQMTTKSYSYKNHKLIFRDDVYSLSSITYTGLLTIINKDHQRTFSLVDKVWMIMNQIFEKQTFLITDYGLIVKKE